MSEQVPEQSDNRPRPEDGEQLPEEVATGQQPLEVPAERYADPADQ